jgi:hypothetical protein
MCERSEPALCFAASESSFAAGLRGCFSARSPLADHAYRHTQICGEYS